MQFALQDRAAIPSRRPLPARGWRVASAATGALALALAGAVFVFHHYRPDLLVLGAALLVLGVIALLHARFLEFARSRLLATHRSLATREQELSAIFAGALDALIILDDQRICREANPAALALLGARPDELVGQSLSRFEAESAGLGAIWPRLLAGDLNRGQVKLLRADGAKLAAEFAATTNMLPGRHLLILRDATERLAADEVKSRSLSVARAALEEARALRGATLALTQDLHLNSVLDTLLRTLGTLVPYQSAQVLLLETSTRLFLAREMPLQDREALHCAETVDSAAFPAVERALRNRGGVLLADTLADESWRDFSLEGGTKSWIGVPMCAGNRVIGLLSVMHGRPDQFTREHLRLAASLAIPATAAIENARLCERAEIYSAELENRLGELRRREKPSGFNVN
jgi:PAS domain S-box-containing protein